MKGERQALSEHSREIWSTQKVTVKEVHLSLSSLCFGTTTMVSWEDDSRNQTVNRRGIHVIGSGGELVDWLAY